MYKNLNTTTDIEENKTTVNKIKHNLADLMVDIENDPTNNVKKKKKIETGITLWKLSNLFLSLTN